jgi:hypothetical protein
MKFVKWVAVAVLGLFAIFIVVGIAMSPPTKIGNAPAGTETEATRIAAQDLYRCAHDKVESACMAHIMDCAKDESTCVNEQEKALGGDMREYLDALLLCARKDQDACARADRIKREKFPQ